MKDPAWKWILKNVFVPLTTALIGAAGAGWAVWVQKDDEVQRERFRNEVERRAVDYRGPALRGPETLPAEAPAKILVDLHKRFPEVPAEQMQEQVQEDWQEYLETHTQEQEQR